VIQTHSSKHGKSEFLASTIKIFENGRLKEIEGLK